MTILKWLLIIVAVGYLGGLAALMLLERSFLYPIQTRERVAPATAGFPDVEEHVLTTADGEKIILWHMPAKPGRPVILYFHGNGDFLAGFFGRFRDIIADGTGVVVPAYRGYSGSSGAPSEEGLLRDAAAAYAFTTARYSPDRIIAWGFSLGTGVATALAAGQPVRKLILEAPFSSTVDVAASLFWYMPVRLVMRDQFRSDERIAGVKVPLLVMHGTDDHAIPIRFGERLFALANEPKRFVKIPGGGHENLANFGAIGIARQFIGATGG
jgi:fermentation-respiration switch protein FrsA (DUF1100 family)